jgi:hypothetical protein
MLLTYLLRLRPVLLMVPWATRQTEEDTRRARTWILSLRVCGTRPTGVGADSYGLKTGWRSDAGPIFRLASRAERGPGLITLHIVEQSGTYVDQKLAKTLAGDLAKSLSRKISIEDENARIQEDRLRGGAQLWIALMGSAEETAGLISRNGDIELTYRQDGADEFTIFATERPTASIRVTHDPQTQMVHWPECEGFPSSAEVILAHGEDPRYHTDGVVISGGSLSNLILKAFVTNP